MNERESNLLAAALRTLNYFGKGAFGTEKLQEAINQYSIEEQENVKPKAYPPLLQSKDRR